MEGLWPIHLKPKDDELLSSWLVRLARSHGMKLHSFCSLTWGRRKNIWNRDIDRNADREMISVLARKTATPEARIRQTLLSSFEGILFKYHNPYGNTPFIIPLRIYHRVRRFPGIQFCPHCLQEDATPYYRRIWRLAHFIVCERHGNPLCNRCARCFAPVNFHRMELGHKSLVSSSLPTRCFRCLFDLRRTQPLICPPNALKLVSELQSSFSAAMAKGWIEIPNYGPVSSPLYFHVIHHLMRLCGASTRSDRLKSGLARMFPFPGFENRSPRIRTCIERLQVLDRLCAVYWTACLLRKWPDAFIRICEECRIHPCVLLDNTHEDPLPQWYAKIVRQHLTRLPVGGNRR
jgi:hypothetical protein